MTFISYPCSIASGAFNQGQGNTGSFNEGTGNTGYKNIGEGNTGDQNQGTGNTGQNFAKWYNSHCFA